MAGIYIHIPFCKTRCIYCDFYSTTQTQLKAAYVNALCKELSARKNYANNEKIDTIYFGGGTPSLLDFTDFEKIFNTIDTHYGLSTVREITLEANPDDLNREYISCLSKLPFNRLSMGIQTFDDDKLKLLNRRHSAQQAINAFYAAREAGFDNISIDLIYGLPGQTQQDWEKDIQQAIELNPEHFSAYHLTYEEDTPLYSMRSKKQVQEVAEESSIAFFETLIRRMNAAGFVHYEISNFCKPGYQSQHNSAYWNDSLYLGCGPSAHSYNGENRQWNISSLTKYIEGIETGKQIYEIEILDKKTRYNDFIITSLRTKEGISLNKLENTYGDKYKSDCLRFADTHIKNGELEIKDNYLRLTPTGIFISDGIMSDLLRLEE